MAEAFQYVLCPYCGQAQTATERCAACGGLFEPLSRMATQISMGPWFIRDKRMPYRPGCSYEALKKQIETGKVKATTVLRGPTTRQFWSVARNTQGVAHLLGYCHECGTTVQRTATACPKCNAKFDDVPQRNELGLMFPTAAAAVAAQKGLEREIESRTNPLSPRAKKPAAAASPSGGLSAPPADLLNEVLGAAGKRSGGSAAGAGAAQALDFAPSQEQDQPVVLKAAGIAPITWVLMAAVALLTIGLVVMVYLNTRQTPH